MMKCITLPSDFPSEEVMLEVLKKTIERSWRIDVGIDDIEAWLSNFRGDYFEISVERRLALWFLCNFTYYAEDEIMHMCHVLFNQLIHRFVNDNDLSDAEQAEIQVRNSAFTSIGRASESGGFILYYFRQASKLDLDRFIFPTEMEDTECESIVCIDDVMLSGGTAERFFHNHIDKLKKKRIYYAALITTSEAIEKLESLGITVLYCAKLDSRSRLFSDESLAFYKYPDLKAHAKEFAEGYGKQIEPKKALGHNGGEYCFGMFYNIPNNSLPIFWSSQNDWHPIFPRKEKYQNAKQAKRKYDYFI